MRPVAEQAAPGFGVLLRQLRDGAGLTQEELAEAAGLSPRSVSDLERGINRTARKDTARLPGDPQRERDSRRDGLLVQHRGQFNQPDPVPEPVEQPGGHLQAQPGLAAPPGPGQGD